MKYLFGEILTFIQFKQLGGPSSIQNYTIPLLSTM